MDIDDRPERLLDIHHALRREFPLPPVVARLDPVSQLVKGIIGGRTLSETSLRAMLALKSQYGSWTSVSEQPVIDIYTVIRDVTFAQNKARYLKDALNQIVTLNGQMTLSPLQTMSVPAALIWLEQLPGVGRKVSASTLNASTLQRRALVIDTHHLRALRRLGFVTPKPDIGQAYRQVMPLLPKRWGAEEIDDHHRLFKRVGQLVCRHDIAHCERCPLSRLCDYNDPDSAFQTLLPLSEVELKASH